MSAARTLPPPEGARMLSDDFMRRIFSIVAMGEGWNGGRERRIEPATAAAAVRLASESLAFTSEPAVGPSPDGSILLEWSLGPSLDMETYVQSADGTYEVVVSRAGELWDGAFESPAEVLAHLEALTSEL